MIGICSLKTCDGSGKDLYATKVNESFEVVAVNSNIIICWDCGNKIIDGLVNADIIQ